jgi:hypothetical protein
VAVQMEQIERVLAEYIIVLRNSRDHCHRAEDRPTYDKHLAEAAVMFAEIHLGGSLAQLKKRVAGERQGYGWGYLSYDEGSAAEKAFDRFATLVEQAG